MGPKKGVQHCAGFRDESRQYPSEVELSMVLRAGVGGAFRFEASIRIKLVVTMNGDFFSEDFVAA